MQTILKRSILIGSIFILYLTVILIVILSDSGGDPLYNLMRICGLCGFLSLSGAVLINLNKPRLMTILGKPFLPVHHLFALSGLILITLHPVIFILLTSDLTAFIPDVSSLYLLLANGGRIAIILVYISFLAVLFRSALLSRWKVIHRLIYPALIIAYIHANLLGTNLSHPVIRLIYGAMIVLIVVTGVVKMNSRRVRK